ncbi:MAG: hypothetical protein K6E10_12880 [Eubacterium sp.]|nr:hypothetical protein [Eubacterium sp.]
MLKFFGRGSGFSDEHNGAYFVDGDRLILIDCPLITFIRLKNEGLEHFTGCKINQIIIIITHTHSDHVGGLALTLHYIRFVWQIDTIVIGPSDKVRTDLDYLLTNLDGCSKDHYKLVTVEEYKAMAGDSGNWLKRSILTKHVPELDGKCFGYNLEIEGKNVVYTGDSNSLENYLPYTLPGSILYTECSTIDSGVHIYIDKILAYKEYFQDNNIEVYLMHLDKEEKATKIIEGTGIQIAPLA